MSVETITELKAEIALEEKNKNQFLNFENKINKLAKGIENNFKKNEDKINTFFKNTEQNGKNFAETIEKAIKAIPFVALMKASSDTLKRFVDLDNFVKRTGISEDFTQKMMAMASVSNISANTITSSLEKITQDLADFRMGTGNINPYAWLGIDLRSENPEKIFEDILQKIQKINNVADRSRALRSLGMDENLANINGASLSGVNTSLFLNKKDRQELEIMNKEVNLFKLNLVLLRDKFIALASPVKTFFELINRLVRGITGIIEKTIGLENFAKILSGIILFFTVKLKPAIAIIGGLALALDDILTYFRGGDSLIGDFIKKGGKLGEVLEFLLDILKYLVLGFKQFLSLAIEGLPNAINVLKGIFDGLLETLQAVKDTVSDIIKIFSVGTWKSATDSLMDKLGKRKEQKDFDKISSWLADRKNITQDEAKQLLNSNYNYNRQNNINVENNYNITGNNSREVANDIKDLQKEQLDNYIRLE